VIAFLILSVSLIVFLLGLDNSVQLIFDENHYVPAARAILSGLSDPNPEHPPLGKLLIAGGIFLFGDNPWGWRIPSAVAGALSLTAVYKIALRFWPSPKQSLWITFLALCTGGIYVQSRIAMLDTFATAFLLWGIWALIPSLVSKISSPHHILGIVLLSLSVLCKWSSIPLYAILVALIFVTNFQVSTQRKFTALVFSRDFFILPLATYFVLYGVFIYFTDPPYQLSQLWNAQIQMFELQKSVAAPHPYASAWYTWPLLIRPIWYLWEKIPDSANLVRGIIFLPNPFITWSAVIAFFILLKNFLFAKRSPFAEQNNYQQKIFFCFIILFYFSWIIIPRKMSFMYYFYPTTVMLPFLLGFVFLQHPSGKTLISRKAKIFAAIAFVFFVYFLPVFSGVPISSTKIRMWAWFFNWI